LRLSIGIAAYPDDADGSHALLAASDARLYEAKRAGGRTVEAGRDLHEPDGGAGEGDLAGFDMLSALVTAVDNKDRYTGEHSAQVATFACALADALGLSPATQRTLRLAGLLHDVGKIGVPDRVLRKPGKLDADEWEAMKQHVALSATLVRAVVPDQNVLAAVAHHHERWDGKGYPQGLAGAEVPLLGRIMIVADAVSAMAMDRPYRAGLSAQMIVAELRKGAGSQFDPALVEPFIAAFTGLQATAA
jgi:putative nucleotidyltransferase with HDIG domain